MDEKELREYIRANGYNKTKKKYPELYRQFINGKKKEGGKITSKVRRIRARAKIRKIRSETLGRRRYILLTCSVCGEEHHIHTNDISVYTEEVKKNWKCLRVECRAKKEEVK